jgi:hypothetical protein
VDGGSESGSDSARWGTYGEVEGSAVGDGVGVDLCGCVVDGLIALGAL